MRSTFHGLETSKRGLFSQQTAMNTAGHNIANANTPGYSRQVVDFTASTPIEAPGITSSTAPGQLGTGVDFSNINRVRESFLDGQFRNQNKGLGDWTVQRDTLEKIETIMNEPSDYGLRSVLDSFWNSWQDLAGQPDNLTARSVVMENSLALTDTINDISAKLTDLNKDLSESINIKVDDANTLVTQIASLNDEIFRVETLGNKANDLRDQRDLLTDQLSKLINIDVKETSRGYTVTSGSTELVSGKTATLLDANSLPADISGGELNGYLTSINHVNTFKSQLDQLVKGLVEGEFELAMPAGTILPEGTTLTKTDGTTLTFTGDITSRTLTSDTTVIVKGLNGLHKLGYTLKEPLQGGGDFFTTEDGSGDFRAGNIQVSDAIKNDVRNIAASTSTFLDSSGTEKVTKGNNQLALWIGQLRNTEVNFDGSSSTAIAGKSTIDEVFRSMIGTLGVKSKEAIRQEDNHELLASQVDEQRMSVSGVSLDEEMANLVKYQQAYNASARMITAIDEMLDKVINGMGVVGR